MIVPRLRDWTVYSQVFLVLRGCSYYVLMGPQNDILQPQIVDNVFTNFQESEIQ